jgi:hypothetical protein
MNKTSASAVPTSRPFYQVQTRVMSQKRTQVVWDGLCFRPVSEHSCLSDLGECLIFLKMIYSLFMY